MKIRNAENKDIPKLMLLLDEIRQVHADARPDVFRQEGVKYETSNLTMMLEDPGKPIFVAVDDADEVLGYAMCKIEENAQHEVLLPHKTLFIDDLCVYHNARKMGVGEALIGHLKSFAEAQKMTDIQLNVWEFPDSALPFYEKLGFRTQRRTMEFPL